MKNDREFWNEKYRHGHHHHHGPNETLVELANMLPAGTALDVGCGEGRDARWLAEHGWKVTGIDLSDVAIARARTLAPDAKWEVVDIANWQPAEQFDLVTSHFMHVAPEARAKLFQNMAASVKPGGRLLFVSHHHSDHGTNIGRPKSAELFFTADEVKSVLEPSQWNVEFAGMRPRTERGVAIHDAVLLARRQP